MDGFRSIDVAQDYSARGPGAFASGVPKVSPDLISEVTYPILEEVREWHSRPLDAVQPVAYFDTAQVKIWDQWMAKNNSPMTCATRLADAKSIAAPIDQNSRPMSPRLMLVRESGRPSIGRRWRYARRPCAGRCR